MTWVKHDTCHRIAEQQRREEVLAHMLKAHLTYELCSEHIDPGSDHGTSRLTKKVQYFCCLDSWHVLSLNVLVILLCFHSIPKRQAYLNHHSHNLYSWNYCKFCNSN